jgi:indole-3-glycerol phosphate synthase
MVSVLCDGAFFDGAFDHVSVAEEALRTRDHNIPILAKEFVIDPRQVEEARDRGADAVLLIARIVDSHALDELVRCARKEGIEPLVEVVDERELDWAMSSGARVIGVNARDLDTLVMDRDRAARVLASIAPDIVAVFMSGVRDSDGVRAISTGRADAALVGETLMRQDDPRELLRSLTSAHTQAASLNT